MNHDNPAARLLAILEKGKQIPPNTNCRQAWLQLLVVDGNSQNALLMSRLGKVMELPEQIFIALKDDFPHQMNSWSHCESQVNSGFTKQNLHASWDSFINYIDVHTINYLLMISDLLQVKTTVKSIADEEVNALREKINNIYEEILESELPDEVKKYVIRYMRKILIGIDEYHLTGVLPLLDAMDTMVGHAMVDAEYKNFLKDTELGKKILDTLSAMASVVTVAVGIPQLTQTIVLLSK